MRTTKKQKAQAEKIYKLGEKYNVPVSLEDCEIFVRTAAEGIITEELIEKIDRVWKTKTNNIEEEGDPMGIVGLNELNTLYRGRWIR